MMFSKLIKLLVALELAGAIISTQSRYDFADDGAFITPDGCKIDQLDNPSKCLTHEDLKKTADEYCTIIYEMKLKDSVGLAPCGDEKFSSIEFECCPDKPMLNGNAAFKLSKQRFMKFLPEKTEGCDPSNYYTQKMKLEESHEEKIAKYIEGWNKEKARYDKLRIKDPNAANKNLKKSIEMIQVTFKSLEENYEKKKENLRAKYADCITKSIQQTKREAMLIYIAVIQNVTGAEDVKTSLQNLMDICEEERNQVLSNVDQTASTEKQEINKKNEVLSALNNINILVNESINLLNFIPQKSKTLIKAGELFGNKTQQTDQHSHPEIDQIFKDYEYFYSVIQEAKDSPPETSTAQHSKTSRLEQSTNHGNTPHRSSPLMMLISEFEKLEPVIDDEDCGNYDGDVDQIKHLHRMKMERLVERYNKAEKAYKSELTKDAFAAERKFRDEVKIFKDALADIEDQSEQSGKRFWSKHTDCLGIQLIKEKKDAMRKYTSTILKHPSKSDEIIRTFQELLVSCQHEQLYQSQKERINADEQKAMIKSHLQELSDLVTKSIEILNFLPVEQSTRLNLASQCEVIKNKIKMA